MGRGTEGSALDTFGLQGPANPYLPENRHVVFAPPRRSGRLGVHDGPSSRTRARPARATNRVTNASHNRAAVTLPRTVTVAKRRRHRGVAESTDRVERDCTVCGRVPHLTSSGTVVWHKRRGREGGVFSHPPNPQSERVRIGNESQQLYVAACSSVNTGRYIDSTVSCDIPRADNATPEA